MILKRLLIPKWRKEKSAEQQPAKELAIDNADPGIRRQACKQIQDPSLLQRILLEDTDAGVRAFAGARLRNLLSGVEPEAPAPEARLAFLEQTNDPVLAAHLALHGRESGLRRAAVERVVDPQTLAECALQDSAAVVRMAAAQRLEDKTLLERVARQIGKKDKNVYREVRRKLKVIAEREEAPLRLRAEAGELCGRLEKLGRRGTWDQDKALLDHLETQWTALGSGIGIPQELSERWGKARSAFIAEYEAYREQNRARIEAEESKAKLLQQKRALVDKLSGLTLDLGVKEIEFLLRDIDAGWNALERLPDGEEVQLRRAYDAAVTDVTEQVEKRRQLDQRKERLGRMTTKAGEWLQRSAPLEYKRIQQWMREGDALAGIQPDDSPAQQFKQVREKIQRKLDKQIAHAEEKLQRLPEHLDLLEHELDEGVLRKATSLHQSINADLALLQESGIGRHRADKLEQRYRQLTPRLREMQNWRKWGTDQHRRELCETMAQLADAELPPEELTDRIQLLQDEWKKLDHSGSPVNESLWKRFHQSADKAYDRCRPFLEQQAAQRAANRKEREDLCLKLEEFLDQVDWARMDWKKAVRAEREMRTTWGSIGPVESKHRRGLEKRFRAAMKRLDDHLANERVRSKALKKDLIARAQTLLQEEDIELAIREIKKLQREWHTTVAAKRKQENALWQQFRETCDRIFARRDEFRQSERDALEARTAARRELCDELNALTTDDVEGPDELLHSLHKLQGRWEQGETLDQANKDSAKLQRRWQDGVKAVQSRIRDLHRAEDWKQLDQLRNRAELCRELEACIEVGAASGADAETWSGRWNDLDTLQDEAAARGIERRFQTSLATLGGGGALQQWRDSLAANLDQRARLCLHLEVLAGIDSPEEAAQQRLAFQVNRLSERLGHGQDDPLDEAPQVERAWYLCGAAPAAELHRLETRFAKALQVLQGSSATAVQGTESGGMEQGSI